MSITTLHEDESFMAELVLCNLQMNFKRYVDYRKNMGMEAYHMYIFHNEDPITK